MIRANLLPRARMRLKFGRTEIDAALIRDAVLGLAIVLVAGSASLAIELFRLQTLTHSAAAYQRIADAHLAQRREAQRVALELARLQALDRYASSARDSGTHAAIAVARMGNALPEHVWLDRLNATPDGFELNGEAVSTDVLSTAVVDLARVIPGKDASLATVDRREGGALHFSAFVGPRAPVGAR